VTTGVLVMAHGTPDSPEEIEAFYTRIRRGRPPTPELLAELAAHFEPHNRELFDLLGYELWTGSTE